MGKFGMSECSTCAEKFIMSLFRGLDGILLDVGNTVFEIRIFSPQTFLLVG